METHFYHIKWAPLSVHIFYYARAYTAYTDSSLHSKENKFSSGSERFY